MAGIAAILVAICALNVIGSTPFCVSCSKAILAKRPLAKTELYQVAQQW